MAQTNSVYGAHVFIEGKGEQSILMIHGWPDTESMWNPQVDFFKKHYRCIRIRLPGFGESGPKISMTLDEITNLIKEVVEKHSLDGKVILMIHDWGAFFGYQFYNKHPEMVSKIIGVDVGDAESFVENATINDYRLTLAYQIPLIAAWHLGNLLGNKISRRIARNFVAPTPPNAIFASMGWPYHMYWLGGKDAYKHHLKAFNPKCPFLFIYGKNKDLMFHNQAWADKTGEKPGNLTIGFDCDHWPSVRKPEQFNETVPKWLNEHAE